MSASRPHRRTLRRLALASAGAALLGPVTLISSAHAAGPAPTTPGNLLVSTSTYVNGNNITAGQTQLPPGCGAASDPCVTAVAGSAYPYVFNNDTVDGSFGVTSPIVLDELTPSGSPLNQITVPNSTQPGVTSSSDQLVTSFSSKSELALNQTTDGSGVTFMGYDAPVDAIDVSNSNTPGAVDPTNPDTPSYYRGVADLTSGGAFGFTLSNAYSGNNGRAAILNSATHQFYAAGNAGNGSSPEAQNVVTGAGAQLVGAASTSESAQTPGAPTPAGSFNIKQLGDPADKSAKDDNFRGLADEGDVLYYTKGSGGNGVNTVYFLDTTGQACPTGVGLPAAGASLPTTSVPQYSTSDNSLGLSTSNPGLSPSNMCILKGFPAALAKGATDSSMYPFGIWFANPTTMYVADEGAGDATFNSSTSTYTAAAASTTAGLEKWVLTNGQWNLAYTLQSGLNLGQPYSPFGYATGLNDTQGGKGGPWSPATDGLRNITGKVNGDGTVTIYGVTSTVSGAGDQGADPNQLVAITDKVGATAQQAGESFQTIVAPATGTVVRGVSFTPAATPPAATPEVPWLPLVPLAAVGVGGAVLFGRRRRRLLPTV